MQFNIPEEHARCSGIYIIRNTINHKVYVGSAVNLKYRHRNHRHLLLNNKHHSRYLQSFCNKYGFDKLSYDLLEIVECKQDLIKCEQRWIDFYKCADRKFGFNQSPTAGSCLGVKHSEETKLRNKFVRLGEKSHKATITEETALDIRKLYHTMTFTQICKKLKLRKSLVCAVVYGYTWPHLPIEDYSNRDVSKIEKKNVRGAKVPSSKLTEKDVLKIRKLYLNMSSTQIAKKYNVSPTLIRNIVKGKAWAHLPLVNYSKRVAPSQSPFTKEDIKQMVKLKETHSYTEIAKIYNVNYTTTYNLIRHYQPSKTASHYGVQGHFSF